MNFLKKNRLLLKQVIIGIIVFLIFNYSYLLQLIPMAIFSITDTNGINGVLLPCFSNFCLVLTLFLIYRKELKKEWKIFISNFGNNVDLTLKYWFIGLLGMIFFNLIINNFLGGGIANNEQAVQGMISTLPGVMIILAGIFAPFSEEIVFRKAFRNIFKNKWLFAFLSGISFGLMHVLTSGLTFVQFLYFIPYSCLGVAFALVYDKTDSVFYPMLAHSIHNTLLIIISII